MMKLTETIKRALNDVDRLKIKQGVNYEKFYLYSLITHSTAIEGSTLTELETQILFDDGLTAKGKPLVDHLMNLDLEKAYQNALQSAKQRVAVTPHFLQQMNADVLHSTGSIHKHLGGEWDSSKGEYRLCGVSAGFGGKSYMNYLKVPQKVEQLCKTINSKLCKMSTIDEQYELSFNAHLNLMSIHPWVDGNGRTGRLLMNYIQFYYNLFPTKVFMEDREEYILSLQRAQETENNDSYLDFMKAQLEKSLQLEIHKFKESNGKGFQFMF